MRKIHTGALALILVAAIVSGCDASSKLLSEAEKSSIYNLSLASEGNKISATTVSAVEAGSAISVSLSRLSGSVEPASLDIVLTDSASAAIATVSYSTTKAKSTTSSAIAVTDFASGVPNFALPATLAPGMYKLVATIRDSSGASLQESESTLLVGAPGFGLTSLSLYPPTSAPGTSVLLSVQVTATGTVSQDSWLRWSIDGRTISSGRLGDGFNKAVWTSPAKAGAYSLDVDLFPSKPSESIASLETPWRQSIKAVVSADAAVAGDEYADTTRLLSHLAFEGDLSDSGTRLQGTKPKTTGSPSLESYPGGFGYKFTENDRISLPGAIPALAGRSIGSTTYLWRLYASEKTGVLYHLDNALGSTIFKVGLDGGVPYAETYDSAGKHRSVSSVSTNGGLINLALSLAPSSKGLSLVWSLDGERSTLSDLPAPEVDSTATSILGGASSLPGVYDEFAISADTAGPPALYFAAMARAWKSDLLIAEGFESSSLPGGSTASGKVKATPRRLSLGPGASLSYATSLSLARPLAVALTFDPTAAAPVMDFRGAAGTLFSVSGTGSVTRADGTVLGAITPSTKGKLSFVIRSNEKTFEIAAKDSLLSSRFEVAEAPQSLGLAVRNPSATAEAGVETLMARVSTDSVGLSSAPSMAKLK